MNRNTILGTIAVGLLLTLAGIVSQQEANSRNYSSNVTKLLPSGNLGNPIQSQITVPKFIANSAKTNTNMSQLVAANNRFGFNLWQQLQAQQASQPRNLLISPNSIAIALSMIRNGTSGNTQAEINTVLGLDQLTTVNVDRSYRKLIKTLNTVDADAQLAIANSLWVNQNIVLKEPFINSAQDFYQAEVSNLDFADSSVKQRINQWVASKTANQIPEIVDSVSPEDALYLINAVYFKGSWTKKFDTDKTSEQPFYKSTDNSKPVTTMSQRGDYRYLTNEQFQAIRLPYGKNAELGMYIFLPQENNSLEQLNQELNLDNWQEWLSQMRSQPGKITLPKFKLEYDTELKTILSSLGMSQVFDATQADFAAMTDSTVAIDTVKHKTAIEVNEEGTEAAAVTSIGVRITSALPENKSFKMKVNRPFFFAIRDDITETILFMGNVSDPE